MPKLVAAVVVCLLALAGTAYAATRSVSMGDNWYVRAGGVPTVTVAKNTTIVWRNRGRSAHNVVVTRGPARFRSGPVRRGGSYRKKVTRAGRYTIVCTIHGAHDQRMTLVVR